MICEVMEEITTIDSPSGALEGVLAYPCESMPETTTLLLSPHPHLGGNMDNNVVRYLAQNFAARGHATLRFNYHGVGNSTMCGSHRVSLREYWARIEKNREYARLLPDIEAAWQALRHAAPQASRELLIGYSLGAVLAGLASQYSPDATVVAIAPPVGRVQMSGFENFRAEKIFVTAGQDFAFDSGAFDQLYASLPEPKRQLSFPTRDHFFRKAEQELFEALTPLLNLEVHSTGEVV